MIETEKSGELVWRFQFTEWLWQFFAMNPGSVLVVSTFVQYLYQISASCLSGFNFEIVLSAFFKANWDFLLQLFQCQVH